MSTVEREVYALAEAFIDDMLRELAIRALVPAWRETLVNRSAEAMQRAIDAARTTIREELLHEGDRGRSDG